MSRTVICNVHAVPVARVLVNAAVVRKGDSRPQFKRARSRIVAEKHCPARTKLSEVRAR
jgi:hypothetical protein